MKEGTLPQSAIAHMKSDLENRPRATFYEVKDDVNLKLTNGSQVAVTAVCPRSRTLIITIEIKKVVRLARAKISPMSWRTLDEFAKDSGHKPVIRLRNGDTATIITTSPLKTRVCVEHKKTVTRIIKRAEVHPSSYETVDLLMNFK